MDNKGNLNLGNLQNLKDINKKLQDIKKYNVKERLPTSTINFTLDKDIIDKYEKIGRDFFSANGKSSQYSGANFFRIIIINFYDYLLLNKYPIEKLNEDQINLIKKTGRRRNVLSDYGYTHNIENKASYTFTIELKFKEVAYTLAYSYFINYKKKNIPYYSLVIFFYDFIKLIQDKSLILTFYDKAYIENWIKNK